jgi:hypothetical protein
MGISNPYETTPAIADSVLGAGATTAAPGVGAALATVATPAAGVYRVTGSAMVIGTPTAADGPNVAVRRGATVIAVLVAGLAGAAGTIAVPAPFTVERVTLDGATNVSLNAIAAGTVGTTYIVAMNLIRVG